ncbi:hypothetical protein [Bradyrhizobium sp. USDA 3364]
MSLSIFQASKRLFAVALLGLGGCAINPVPDDYAHISASNIARQVRCEARQAVIDATIGFLASETNNENKSKVDDHSHRIGLWLRDHPEAITTFDPSRLTGFARVVVELLYGTGIAYYYDLTGLEINNIDPTANLVRPTPITSLVTLGLTASFDRQRQNEWTFTITDKPWRPRPENQRKLLHGAFGSDRKFRLPNCRQGRHRQNDQGVCLDEPVRELGCAQQGGCRD